MSEAKETLKAIRAANVESRKEALRSGPEYNAGGCSPLLWHDQVFGYEIEPSGTVVCDEPLYVGATQNGLDVVIVASHANKTPVSFAAGASITLKTLVADQPDGTFVETGPSVCVVAPAAGIAAEADQLAARLPLADMEGKYVKIKLVFAGTITGGTVDAALHYLAR